MGYLPGMSVSDPKAAFNAMGTHTRGVTLGTRLYALVSMICDSKALDLKFTRDSAADSALG